MRMDAKTIETLKRIQCAMLEGRTSATSEANAEMTALIRKQDWEVA
jgi:hypothetical protein